MNGITVKGYEELEFLRFASLVDIPLEDCLIDFGDIDNHFIEGDLALPEDMVFWGD